MINAAKFHENNSLLQEQIEQACYKAERSSAEVRVLPVTKTYPELAARLAYEHGYAAVGENRVQEAAEKRPAAPEGLRWELIGHLQSNKAKQAVETFDCVQSVDSEKLARRLDAAAQAVGKTLAVLLQVNAGDDPAKFGVSCPEAASLLDVAQACTHLRVDGLMTIAPLDSDPEVARRAFARLRQLRDQLAADSGLPLKELSMGMSGDLEAAILEGSTTIRVGSALFGSRD